ncbi:MAG TPA: RluA family pseudouridine synthase [Candidatus Omnitrophota bacterium]|nr:RluA family pseudouridine synthase [Candidatus Omnitrophota bacterium]
MPTYTFCIAPEDAHKRLDVFLAKAIPLCPSRAFVQHLIKSGSVSINGIPRKNNYKLIAGETVDVSVQDKISFDVKPENIPLDVFYEDSVLIVINKPSGMTVHPGAGCGSGTLVNALLCHCKKLSNVNDDMTRPGIVHRLDKETSGLMVAVKSNRAHVDLAHQFEGRIVKKCYVALVEGCVEFDEGVIDAPLGPDPLHRQKRSVLAREPKEAQTFYRVLKRFSKASLVLLMPRTGRMHQLRVHMAHLGHPFLGDEKYGKKNSFSRLALHAKALAFFHPQTKAWVEFSSPTPSEFLLG